MTKRSRRRSSPRERPIAWTSFARRLNLSRRFVMSRSNSGSTGFGLAHRRLCCKTAMAIARTRRTCSSRCCPTWASRAGSPYSIAARARMSVSRAGSSITPSRMCRRRRTPGSREDEIQILQETTRDDVKPVKKVLTGENLLALQHCVKQIPVPPSVAEYAVDLVQSTRPASATAPDFIKKYIQWGP